MSNNEEIGKRLLQIISAKKLTQRELAIKFGIAFANFNKWIKGTRGFTLKNQVKLCQWYPDINPRWLRDGEGDMFLNAEGYSNIQTATTLNDKKVEYSNDLIEENKLLIKLLELERTKTLRLVEENNTLSLKLNRLTDKKKKPTDIH